ncbi:MAG: hypothetical protein EZS28_045013, partial [Streblomastix strix]
IGGTTKAILNNESNSVSIQNCKYTLCKALYTSGGAIFVELKNPSAQITLTQTIIDQCESQSGGGIYSIFSTGGQIQINDLCKFSQCKATSGNGGGIYAQFNFASACIFKINSGTISECDAIANSSMNSPTGYGGGIMLVGTGDYISSSLNLSLKGMNISQNTAAQSGGKSLYVAMTKLAGWCRYGQLGEFVKGNYSDADSDEADLQGIPVDYQTFISYNSNQIQNETNNLEDYWKVRTEKTDLYVKSDGNDDLFCTSTIPCKTLDAYHISNNINIPYIYQVYIIDSSSIDYKAEITQTSSERIYGPLANESTTVRNLLIEPAGQFDVKGKILFNYINFVVQATQLTAGQHTIQGLLSTSQISLQNCQYHMASSEISIGKSLVCMLKGGTQTITNLIVSDITSVENIIKAEFDESGTLAINNCQFERVTKDSSTVIGGTTKAILNNESNSVSIQNCKYTLCKALYTSGGAIFVELKN